jgi:hypothetical protein
MPPTTWPPGFKPTAARVEAARKLPAQVSWLQKRAAIESANSAVSQFNSEMEACADFRRSVMGQGCAVDYSEVSRRECDATVGTVLVIEQCLEMDPTNADLQKLHSQLVSRIPYEARRYYPDFYAKHFPKHEMHETTGSPKDSLRQLWRQCQRVFHGFFVTGDK